MALYIDGIKVVNSLVIDGNTGGTSLNLLYSINQSQGNVWINTDITASTHDKFVFIYSDDGDKKYTLYIDVSDIAVYTGGTDVYTIIFAAIQIGRDFNIRIYNDKLYVSFNGTGASTRVVGVYEEVSSGGSKQIAYLKWRINNTRSNPVDNAVQSSEFYLYLNNVLYNWNSNVSITASLPPYSAGESIEHIIDGSVDTKYVTTAWGGSYVGQCDIIISLGETITIDNNTSYAYATGNDEPSRDPVGWTLFGSIDGSNWFALDSRDSANVPTARKTSTDRFSITV